MRNVLKGKSLTSKVSKLHFKKNIDIQSINLQ